MTTEPFARAVQNLTYDFAGHELELIVGGVHIPFRWTDALPVLQQYANDINAAVAPLQAKAELADRYRKALELIAKNAPEMGGDWALMKAQSALAQDDANV